MTPELYVFVWQGKGVLEDYATGLVVVIAPTVETAWEKLKQTDFSSWAELYHGTGSWISDQDYLDWWLKDQLEDGEPGKLPIQPQRIELNQAPAFIKRGGG